MSLPTRCTSLQFLLHVAQLITSIDSCKPVFLVCHGLLPEENWRDCGSTEKDSVCVCVVCFVCVCVRAPSDVCVCACACVCLTLSFISVHKNRQVICLSTFCFR